MTRSQSADSVYERFLLVACGPALFSATVSATDLDLFHFLSRHPNSTFEEIRESLQIPVHSLRVLLLAICSIGLIEKKDGRYSNSSVAEDFLASAGPDNWTHILRSWQQIQYAAFPYLTSALREGTNTGLSVHPGSGDTLYQRLTSNPRLEGVFHTAMQAITLQAIEGLRSNRDFETIHHLLDVGGGNGITARVLTERHPKLKVTIFDLPTVAERIPAAQPQAESPGLSTGRISVLPGNMFQDPFPRDADAILFSHLLEIFSADEITALLSKAFDALPRGGKVFIYGFVADDDERGGVLAARLSVYFAVLASGRGMGYPSEDYKRWLRETGFGDLKVYLSSMEHGLIVGTKE